MSSEVTEIDEQRSRSRVAGFVLAATVMALMTVVNLPYNYVESNSKSYGGMDLLDTDTFGFHHQERNMPRMAGWPLNYWVQYQTEAGPPEDRFWSLPRLLANIGIALVASLAVYLCILLRHRQTLQPGRTLVAFDVGIALLIFLVPAGVIGWNHRVSSQHRQLSRELLRRGNVRMSCWLPAPVAEQIPRGLKPSFSRVREVLLVNAGKKTVRRVAGIPTLTAMRCFACETDAEVLSPLKEHVHFHALELTRSQVSMPEVDVVVGLRWLDSLGLARTNLDASMLRRFDHLNLKAVDLAGTSLELSELGAPEWSQTVEGLNLSRPRQGESASLTIDGWPKLRRLSVSRFTTRMNEAELTIRLENLPKLEYLHLDRLQKHNCTFRNLPRLSMIDEGLDAIRQHLRFDALVPGLMWVSHMEVDGAPSLSVVGCYARDLDTVSIRRMPALKSLSIGSYDVSPLGDLTLMPVKSDRCQFWVDELGKSVGPPTVDLTGLPLGDCDLSPLADNPRIRDLRLGQTGISYEQVQDLAGLTELEMLDLYSCPLEADQLTAILDQFPHLSTIRIDASELEIIDIEGNDRLKSISATSLANAEVIRLVDSPAVETYIRTKRTPSTLELREVPALRGLVIESDWPKNSIVSGLRDLEWFAGGGENVDDELLDVLLDCRSMEQLTLAYTSVTQEKLSEIKHFDQLRLLAVPGSNVNDEVTEHWKSLQSLWEINLDDTRVSAHTLAWLSQIDSLRRVSLNRVPLDDAAAELLGELDSVSELHLAGMSINPEKLRRLLASGNLESLNLSGWTVDEALIDVIAASDALRHLILRDSDVDAEMMERMLEASPNLYVELDDVTHLDSDLQDKLHERAEDVSRQFRMGWREAFQGDQALYESFEDGSENVEMRSGQMMSRDYAGRIDVRVFRPKSSDQASVSATTSNVSSLE